MSEPSYRRAEGKIRGVAKKLPAGDSGPLHFKIAAKGGVSA
jgi:hypothetical protein